MVRVMIEIRGRMRFIGKIDSNENSFLEGY